MKQKVVGNNQSTTCEMANILCQYTFPTDQTSLNQYESWITQGVLDEVMTLEGLVELRAFRDYAAARPRVTIFLSFRDLKSALQAASAGVWRALVSNLTYWGATGVEVTLLEPSPLLSRDAESAPEKFPSDRILVEFAGDALAAMDGWGKPLRPEHGFEPRSLSLIQ